MTRESLMMRRFEAAAQVPQVLAFEVRVADVEALRKLLRAALERGDLSPARVFWEARKTAFDERAHRVRWRVPSGTVVRACKIMDERASALALDPEHEATARAFSRALAILEARAARCAHLDIAPEPWFVLESLAFQLAWEHRLSAIDAFSCERAVVAIDELFGPTAPRERPGPAGSFDWIRSIRFRLEDAASDQEDISWERVRNVMRDVAVYREPRGGSIVGGPGGVMTFDRTGKPGEAGELVQGTPYTAAVAAIDQLGLDDLAALVVGPYSPSEGPAAFLTTRSVPLLDRTWNLLPLFRLDVPAPGDDWSVIEGDALRDAARDVRSATGPTMWWLDELDDEWRKVEKEAVEAWGATPAPEPFVWHNFASLSADDFLAFRDRFAALLERASDAANAVLLTHARPDCQGELRPPATRAWGWPVVSETS